MAPPVATPHSSALLLSPLRVRRHTLRNRVVMGSMHTRLEHMDAAGIECHLIGGVRHATQLDAARAIDEGTRLAQRL